MAMDAPWNAKVARGWGCGWDWRCRCREQRQCTAFLELKGGRATALDMALRNRMQNLRGRRARRSGGNQEVTICLATLKLANYVLAILQLKFQIVTMVTAQEFLAASDCLGYLLCQWGFLYWGFHLDVHVRDQGGFGRTRYNAFIIV